MADFSHSSNAPVRPASRREFEIAVICALTIEANAVQALFDHCWDDEGAPYDKVAGDPNAYTTGTIGRLNIVLVHMPRIGSTNAAAMAVNCRRSFPNIKLGLVVGICGVVPFTPEGDEIVLGDVIISDGIIQYDFGRRLPDGFIRKDTLLDSLGRPNSEISALLAKLRGIRGRKTLRDTMTSYMGVLQKLPELGAEDPGSANDRLFEPSYHHLGDGLCEQCGCNGNMVPRGRLQQASRQPAVHFGLIASGHTVMKSGQDRDAIARKEGIIAFEMEGAGVWDIFPCVVIKGACDYADSHKCKLWQQYAAATAAACMKAFLRHWEPSTLGLDVSGVYSASTEQDRIFNIPLDRNRNYVTRAGLEMQLYDAIQPQQPADTKSKRVALWGLGGAGKTELVLRFVENYRQYYRAIFWINGASWMMLVRSLAQIATLDGSEVENDPETCVERASVWLKRNHHWLLVVDNLDDESTLDQFHRRVLGVGVPGPVIITSRNEVVKNQWYTIEVSDMDHSEGVSLVRQIAGQDVAQEPATNDLVQELGYLPLAIDQAASYIRAAHITAELYLRLYRVKRSEYLRKYASTQYNVDSRETVMTTWNISFQKVSEVHPQAAVLLLLVSLLEVQDIPLLILQSCIEGQYHWTKKGEFERVPEGQGWIPPELQEALESQAGFIEAKLGLTKFGFLRDQPVTASIRIHPLVQYWASQRVEVDTALRLKLIICWAALLTSSFAKQDQFPPFFDPALQRVPGSVEERKLDVWPLRKYHNLALYARRCLVLVLDASKRTCYSSNLQDSGTGLIPAHLALPLLQVLEYSTFGDLDTDLQHALALTDIYLGSTPKEDDNYTIWSALLWRIRFSRLCVCRRHKVPERPLQEDSEQLKPLKKCMDRFRSRQLLYNNKTYRNMLNYKFRGLNLRNALCSACRMTLFLAKNILQWPSTPRALAILPVSDKRLPDIPELLVRRVLWMRNTPNVSRLEGLAWMEQYHCSIHAFLWLRAEESRGDDKVYFSTETALAVSDNLKSLCGPNSEEYRRSSYYAALYLKYHNRWEELLSLLEPVVAESMRAPNESWSHERCIILYIESLVKCHQTAKAKEIGEQIQKAYRDAGKTLVTIERSNLLRDNSHVKINDPPMNQQFQLMIKSLNGRTEFITIDINATVEDLMRLIDRGSFWESRVALRLLYGGKQLEARRLISDYGIGNLSKIDVVMRLQGGRNHENCPH